MTCPFCHDPVTDQQPAVALPGGAKAHQGCVAGRPFRERVSFEDRADPDAKPLKERELRG